MKKDTIIVSKCDALVSQWDWESNTKIGLRPDCVSIGSQKQAFWICKEHGASYQQVIRARYRGETGCSQCKENKRKSRGRERYISSKTVLSKSHPELVEEWIQCSDPKFTPDTCLASTKVIVRWKCKKCNGFFDAYVSNRAYHGSGCPYCAGQKALSGYNDLKTLAPDLAAEWSDKNLISPTDVTLKSNKKVYWVCKLGHDDYLTSPKLRSNGQGCPECAKRSHTSFPEQAILFYVRQAFPDAVNRYNCEGHEIDIYVPSISVGIEYNGSFYHRGKEKQDSIKRGEIEKRGIRLITVYEMEDKSTFLSSPDTFAVREYCALSELSRLIEGIMNMLQQNCLIDINCERDRIAISEQYINSLKERSIAAITPDIVREWDKEKNGKIQPQYVSFGSNQKYYWVCSKCGYNYLASPKERNRGRACPCCAGKVVVTGKNDLMTNFPKVAAEWDYELNGELSPKDIQARSYKKVWWRCKEGHVWSASVSNRTKHGNGCPFCSGSVPVRRENDLATTHPELISEWDFKKNVISPREVRAGTNKKVWWRCKGGHVWLASVANRVQHGSGCPYCSNRQVMKGFNDLLTKNPQLAIEWDFENNKGLTPDMVTSGTHRKVWWKCPECGHSWPSKVVNRNNHTGCPNCHHKYWE